MVTNAHGMLGTPPEYGLIGPTVDDDMRRLVDRYGADLVKEAAKRLTKKRRGRPKIHDWPILFHEIDRDARVWLDGGDPFAARTDYSIAKDYADANPGHNHAATMERIERKLRHKRRGRKWYVLVKAQAISHEEFPYTAHLRALEALSKCDGHDAWQACADRVHADIADYTAKWGKPGEEITARQIRIGAREPLRIGFSRLGDQIATILKPYIRALEK